MLKHPKTCKLASHSQCLYRDQNYMKYPYPFHLSVSFDILHTYIQLTGSKPAEFCMLTPVLQAFKTIWEFGRFLNS